MIISFDSRRLCLQKAVGFFEPQRNESVDYPLLERFKAMWRQIEVL